MRLARSSGIRPRAETGASGKFVVRDLPEVVSKHTLVERACVTRHGRDTCSARRGADALYTDEGAKNSQRKIRVMGFDRLIEPFRKLALAGQRAMPFAAVVDDAANLPLR